MKDSNLKLKIGIQGNECSTNERACLFFAKKYNWKDFEIIHCSSTEGVLSSLENNKVDYGTFAWKSSRSGLVQETQEAIKRHVFMKIDEVDLQIDHALFYNSKINKNKIVKIFSHDQALKEHKPFLEREFPFLKLESEIDTAIAAKKLQNNMYPENSLIIAPIGCAEKYGIDIFLDYLPTNKGYTTTIYLVKKNYTE